MMKARLLKILPLFLVALLVASGVFAGLPGKVEAAKVTYKVGVMNPGTPWDRMNPAVNNESPVSTIVLVNSNKQPTAIGSNEGTTYDLVVDTKLKKKKVKIGGQKVVAQYYKVKIPKKSYRVPDSEYWTPMGLTRTTTELKSNAKGMLYVENGDVDVMSVLKKKAKTKIGDGKVDPYAREDFQGAMIIQMKTQTTMIAVDTGKKFMKLKMKNYTTTGTSSIVVSGSKTALDGMALPASDTSGLLTGALRGPAGSLQGQPIDLDAGTGTLVSTSGTMKGKSALGRVDRITASVSVLSIKR
jgi:hypothetical protein